MTINNKGKGGKKKRRGVGGNSKSVGERGLVLSDGPEQFYAQAIKMLGDRRIVANCYCNGHWVEKMIMVRGKFRKRIYVNINDFVLVSTRECDDGLNTEANRNRYASNHNKNGLADSDDESKEEVGSKLTLKETLGHGGDIIHVYQASEVRQLVKMGELKLPQGDGLDDPNNRRQNVYYMDSDEELEDEELDKDGNPLPKIAPQSRNVDMPSSGSDSEEIFMTETDLQTALDAL